MAYHVSEDSLGNLLVSDSTEFELVHYAVDRIICSVSSHCHRDGDFRRLSSPSRSVLVKPVACSTASGCCGKLTSNAPARNLLRRRAFSSRSHLSFSWNGERELDLFLEETKGIQGEEWGASLSCFCRPFSHQSWAGLGRCVS